jgi:hypothetical protein
VKPSVETVEADTFDYRSIPRSRTTVTSLTNYRKCCWRQPKCREWNRKYFTFTQVKSGAAYIRVISISFQTSKSRCGFSRANTVYSIFENKVHIILMQRDAWYKTWYMRGVLYAILPLQNSCSVDYLLPTLETVHNTTTEKSIRLFTDVAMRSRGTWQNKKKMTQRNSCTTQPKQIFMVLLVTKTFALFLELFARL